MICFKKLYAMTYDLASVFQKLLVSENQYPQLMNK